MVTNTNRRHRPPSHNTAVSHQQQLFLALPALRQADQLVRKFWLDVRRDGHIQMKKLFVEMLESVSSTTAATGTGTADRNGASSAATATAPAAGPAGGGATAPPPDAGR